MNTDEVLDLIALGEGQRVEFKTSFAEDRPAIESLGAFSNADGGAVLFGVLPNGEVCGTHIGGNTLENFANKLRRESQPPLSPRIETLTLEDEIVVAVSLEAAPPGQLIHVYSKALVRVGRTNQLMSSEAQKARLLSDQANVAPDEDALISGATSDDGRAGFIWVENPGVAEGFCVRLTGFDAASPGKQLRALWSTGEEERILKRGDRDWCRILELEPDSVKPLLSQGDVRIPIGRGDYFRAQMDRRGKGQRKVRFLGKDDNVDLVLELGKRYVMEVVVLSDTRPPVSVQVAYGVGGDRIVLPFDENVMRPMVEQDLAIRRKIEDALKGNLPQAETASEVKN